MNNNYLTGQYLRHTTEKGIPLMELLHDYYKRRYWWRFWKQVSIAEVFEFISDKKVSNILVTNLINKYIGDVVNEKYN